MRDWKVYWMLPVLVVCFAGIFALVLSLEGAPVGAVGYALLLCLVLGALVYGLCLLHAWRQRERLREALQKLPYRWRPTPYRLVWRREKPCISKR